MQPPFMFEVIKMIIKDYDPYHELALEIVAQMCDDYIKSCKLIEKYRNKPDLSRSQWQRLMLAYRHKSEDIAFFDSERPYRLCGIQGHFILRQLNEQLKTHSEGVLKHG